MNPNFLDFEQPIADLEAKIQELRRASTGPAVNIDAEVQRPAGQAAACAPREIFSAPHALADFAAGPPSAAAVHARLPRPDLRRIPRTRRRPRLRRRRRDRRRPGPHRRPRLHGDRPAEGPRHQEQDPAQLRHAAPRGLSQGAAPDEDGRTLRPAAVHLHRHARRLSGHRRRGTRPVRSDRAQPAGNGRAAHPGHLHGDRRRRLRRRAGDRRRRPHADARSTAPTR